jgi:plastocyanin
MSRSLFSSSALFPVRRELVLVSAIAFLIAGCGGGGGGGSNVTGPGGNTTTGGTTGTGTNAIVISNTADAGQYSPPATTVAKGTTVTWTWSTCDMNYGGGQTCVAHSVTFDDGATSDTQDHGTYSRTFTTAGTYNYHCAVHGNAMTGKIVVQ